MHWKKIWMKLMEISGKKAALISLSVMVGAGSVGASVGAGTYRVSDYDYHSEEEMIVQIVEPEPAAEEEEVVEMAPEIDALFSEEEEPVEEETQELTMVGSSIEKDLKIKIQNQKNKLVAGEDFHISVQADKKGAKASEYNDHDKDGIIYIKEIAAGKYTVTLQEIEGYEIKTGSIKVTVKDQIEYKKVDVADEIKKESEINTALEDTAVNDIPVESTATPMMATRKEAVSKDDVKKPEFTKTESKASVSGENKVTFQKVEGKAVSTQARSLLLSIFRGLEVRAAEKSDVAKAQEALTTAQTALEAAEAKNKVAQDELAKADQELQVAKKNTAIAKAALDSAGGAGNDDSNPGETGEGGTPGTDNTQTELADLKKVYDEAAAEEAAKQSIYDEKKKEADAAAQAVTEAKQKRDEAEKALNDAKKAEEENQAKDKVTDYSMAVAKTALLYDSDSAAANSCTLTLTITGNPVIQDDKITWTSSDEKVCKVAGSGTSAVVTRTGKGDATVTASLRYDSGNGYADKSVACAVTVKAAEEKETPKDPSAELVDKNGAVVYLDEKCSVVAKAKDYLNAEKFYRVVSSGNIGIDVSKYQGNIDWNKVAASGVSFAIIRAGYRGATQGSLVVDPYFKQNIQGATRAGIKVGVYFFTQAVNEAEAVEEASMVLSLVSGYRLAYPIFIDTENASNGRANGLGVSARTAVCKAFCRTVQNGGYKAGVYASKSWFNNKLNTSSLNKYCIWVAQYNSTLTYSGKRDLWQYTSSGSVNGISGRVDMNISYTGY